jgi:O-antigen/teichoic acid export membrane protein
VEPSLTRRTGHGFIWMLLQTFVSKIASTVAQIAVAWYLSPHDFSLVWLSWSIAAFPALLRDAGMQTILVQRQKHLRIWIGPIFWLSLTLGVASTLLMAGLGPLAARIYDQPKLTPLIAVVAAGALFSALGTVPTALVQIQLRFRFQATTTLLIAMGTLVLNVVMAWRGYGAYSYVLPQTIAFGARTVIYWMATSYRVSWRLYLRRWRYIYSDSGAILAAGFVGMVIYQGDKLVIGLFHKHDDVVGIWGFAFNLSWQMMAILTYNFSAVLFPALAKLRHDPSRQVQAYLRSARVLAMVGVPACFLQAAVAYPAFHAFFKPKWYVAIAPMQVLCVAMAIRTVGVTWNNLLSAQGRNRLEAKLNGVFCVIFLACVAVAARFGATLAVSYTEAIFFIVTDPLAMYVTLRTSGLRSPAELIRVFSVPLAVSAVSVGLGWLAATAVPTFRGADLVKILVTTGVCGALYIPLIRIAAPGDWNELLALRRRPK